MTEQSGGYPFLGYNALAEYLIDAGQRTLLYWDVMRQRGNQYLKHMAETVPHVFPLACALVRWIATAGGPLGEEGQRRLAGLAGLFGGPSECVQQPAPSGANAPNEEGTTT